MNKVLAWSIPVAAVVAALAWFLLGGASAPGPAPADPTARKPSAEGGALGGTVTVAEEALPAALTGVAREQLAPDGGDAERRPLVVQVFERDGETPAAHAQVFVAMAPDLEERIEQPFAPHASELVERHGRRFRTDEQGRAVLPPVREWAAVAAQKESGFGFRFVGEDHGEVEVVKLEDDQTVTVRVIGEGDAPVAAVPVGVTQDVPTRQSVEELLDQWQRLAESMARVEEWMKENPNQAERAQPRIEAIRTRQERLKGQFARLKEADGKGGKGKGKAAGPKVARYQTRTSVRGQRRTDDAGLAVFRHLQLYRKQRDEWWPETGGAQFHARLLIPLARSVEMAFTANPAPDDILELRMPATGSLALRTIDRDGRPFTHPVGAQLRVDGTRLEPWNRREMRKEQDEGSIEFPFVGLGLRFTANCSLDDEDFRWQMPSVQGPQVAGERAEIDLVVAPEFGMLFGQLSDEAGDPLGGEFVTFLITSRVGRLEGEEVHLDRDGRFHLPYLHQPDRHRGPFRLEIRREDTHPTEGRVVNVAALPPALVTDIGALELGAFDRIAYGVVTDDRGEPLEDALVQLEVQRDVGEGSQELEWVEEAFVAARTSDDGRFELFADLLPGRYRLSVEADEHFDLRSEDLRGDRLLHLELMRKARVVGTVLTPEWMKSWGITTRLEPVAVEGEVDRRDDRIHDHDGKRYIYFDWVRPGVYDLSLRVRAFPDPFLIVDRLEIAPGQVGIHPRLKDLDVAAFLYRFEITATDENGQQIEPDRPLLAGITRPDGTSQYVALPWKGGRVETVSAAAQLEVIPIAGGFQADRTVLVAGQNQIPFRRIPPIELEFAGLTRMTGDLPVNVIIEAVALDGLPNEVAAWDRGSQRMAGWYQKSRYAWARVEANDIASMSVIQGGTFRAHANVGDKRTGRPIRVDLGEFSAAVRPGAGPTRVAMQYEVAAFEAAVTELRSRQQGR